MTSRSTVVPLVAGLVLAGALALLPGPAAAASLQGQVLGRHAVQLDWVPRCVAGGAGPPCNGYTTLAYLVYLRNGTYQMNWEYVDTVENVAVTSYTVIGLQAATTYQFRVHESSGWYDIVQSNVVTLTTEPPPNGRPSLAFTSPAPGMTFDAGAAIAIEWTVTDDRDLLDDLVVFVNYTGPASGAIAGPLSGRTNRIEWTLPGTLPSGTYRIAGVVHDTEGGRRPAESPEFAVRGHGPAGPGGSDAFLWQITTAILSVGVAGLTAGLLLAVRVQLSEWYRRKREERRRRAWERNRQLPPV